MTALLAVGVLGLVSDEIALAGVSSSPFPNVVTAPAAVPEPEVPPPGDDSGPGASGPSSDDGSTPGGGTSSENRNGRSRTAAPEPEPDAPRDRPTPPAVGTPGGPDEKAPDLEDPPTRKADVPDPAAAPAPKAVTPAAATAADRHGWGSPLPGSDEFDYTGAPNPSKWNVAGECWAGHAGNGKRCASRSTVDGSKLVQTGLANGDSGWVASKVDQRYGRWEARVRSKATGPANGRQYHPLLIVWPTSNQWPQDGEYDFLENGAPGQDCAESFIHYPHAPGAVQQEFIKEKDCGAPLSEWHNVAFEWTPDHVRGFIDGKQWFDLSGGAGGSRRKIQDMPSGHLTIQLDNFFGAGMQPATYEVDWVRIYGLR